MTLREALTAAKRRLAANPHLHAQAARDAELLLLHHLGITKAQRLAHPDRELTAEEELGYRESILRRLANEPIQYITGQQEFYGLPFHVTPAVLIPRPETEHLVEAVLERLPRHRPLRILDVGTGSGILAIILARQLPDATITAVDISAQALAVARRNAETHQIAARIRFLESDLFNAVDGEYFDAVVSNPPYVPATGRATLQPQVRDYEPAEALFAGLDGLDLYRRLIPAAHAALVPGGLLALEIGHGQSAAIAALLESWHNVSFQDDLQAIPRVALATRPH
jgi:release factor glutamine methyltransferase